MGISFKIDLLKILVNFKSNKNILFHDFDRFEYCDIDIDKNSMSFPKFFLLKIYQEYSTCFCNPTLVPEQIIYMPTIAKKLF